MDKEICKGTISIKALILPLIVFLLFVLLAIIFLKESLMISIDIVIFGLMISGPAFIRYKNTFLTIFEKKVKGEVGIFRKQTLNAPLDKINDVYVYQGIFGRIFGYGTINISTSSSNFTFKGISECKILGQKLLEQIEIYKKEQMKENARLMAEAMKQNK